MGFFDKIVGAPSSEGTAVASSATTSSILGMIGKIGLVFAIGGIIWYFYKEWMIFRYTAVIERRRQDNVRKTIRGKCGYTMKNGQRAFVIKWGFKPSNRKVLDYVPDTRFLDNNTFYFDQLDPDTFIQKKLVRTPKLTRVRTIQFLKDLHPYKATQVSRILEDISGDYVTKGFACYVDNGDVQMMSESEDLSYEPVARETKQLYAVYAKGLAGALNIDGNKIMKMMVIGLIILGGVIIGAIALLR